MEMTRRGFVQASATVAAVNAIPFVWASAPLHDVAAADVATKLSPMNADLLAALGARIGFEAAARVSPAGDPVSMSYVNHAGAHLAPLFEGVERGAQWQCAAKGTCVGATADYGAVLATVTFSNVVTRESVRVEIDSTSLSHLAMIEAGSPSPNIRHHAVMAAPSDSMYRLVA